MGGYFSTRWNYERTRQDTSSLLFLDVAKMRTMGALEPGAFAWQEWTNGRGEVIGSIQTCMNAARDTLTLIYSVREDEGEWKPIREAITLEATSCNYGGKRLWLTCPGCHSRRRVLYSLGGRFRCRQCHDLAYTSTREDDHERSIRRMNRLQKRLGTSKTGLFHIPEKPRGMHWNTYERIVRELLHEHDIQEGFFQAFIDKRKHLLLERLGANVEDI